MTVTKFATAYADPGYFNGINSVFLIDLGRKNNIFGSAQRNPGGK